jgi:hypothetical protein
MEGWGVVKAALDRWINQSTNQPIDRVISIITPTINHSFPRPLTQVLVQLPALAREDQGRLPGKRLLHLVQLLLQHDN